MTIWEILGITPTTDLQLIKMAYANQAKKVHPEEHPEEFTLLQKAYKAARRYAKENGKNGTPKSSDMTQPIFETKDLFEQAQEQDKHISSEMDSVHTINEPETIPEENAEHTEKIDTETNTTTTYKNNASKKNATNDLEESIKKLLSSPILSMEKQLLFVQRFSRLLRNPYALNSIVCWDTLLKAPEYEDAWNNLEHVKLLYKRMKKIEDWEPKTIDYFCSWFHKKSKEAWEPKLQKYFRYCEKDFRKQLERDRRKKTQKKIFRFFYKDVQAPLDISETTEMQSRLLRVLEEKTGTTDFTQDNAVATYLDLYFTYAENIEYRAMVAYKTKAGLYRGSNMATTIFYIIVILIWLLSNFRPLWRDSHKEVKPTPTPYRMYQFDDRNTDDRLKIILPTP